MSSILIVGKPNTGKSLLFNRLTGLKQKVSNFPGVTVEVKQGQFDEHKLLDFPGIYSLNAISRDEEVAIEKLREALVDDNTTMILCTLDASRLERSLIFGLQAQNLAKENNKGFIFALNMIDETDGHNHSIDEAALAKELGSPVISLSARTLKGFDNFRVNLLERLKDTSSSIPTKSMSSQSSVIAEAKRLGANFACRPDIILKNQNKIDSFLLNSWLGGLVFFGIMFLLFQSIFTWASPLMDAVEASIELMASWAVGLAGTGMFADFLQDALFGGFGSFLVFVPQIVVLTFIIGILEDSGYLARAALICHKPLSFFGLSGKSFIPFLTGHACAIPAIMAARTIESPRKRLITMMTVPLMSCSARLPVYALLITALFPQKTYLGGLIELRGVVFFLTFLTGIIAALIIAAMISKFSKETQVKDDMPFILELPSYRLPHWKPLFLKVLNAGKNFVTKAGPIIFTVSVIVWVLGYFPNGGEDLSTSYLGRIGHFIEPIFKPLGVDWRYGVAILVSFLAREVFVGTLGTLFGMEGADENIAGLSENIQADGLAFGTGLGLLLFYVIALQCVATVAVLKAETGSNKIAWGLFAAYGALAYVLAAAVSFIF